MAEIVLIFPKFGNWQYGRDLPNSDTIPVGLLSIGSVLKKEGFAVKIIDGNLCRNYLEEVITEITKPEVLFTGISVMTTQIPEALSVAEVCRKKRSDLPLVWGGIHPTLFPEQTCHDKAVDIVVFGEGEYSCLDLAWCLKDKRNVETVRGIAYKANGQIRVNKSAQAITLDALPFPDYDLLDAEKYALLNIKGIQKRSLAVHSGIGCPHRCSFCINTLLYKRKRRAKSTVRILAEIEYLIEKYKIDHVSFRDENFFSSRAEVLRFLDEVQARKLKFTWDTTVRADYFCSSYLSEEVLKKLRETGCIRLGIGVESASARVLDYLCKDITLQDVEASALLCKKFGIYPYYSFMIALPGESEKEMLDTAEFIIRLRKLNPDADIITPQIYRPYPGNELYEHCRHAGFKEPENLKDWARIDLDVSGYASGNELPWIRNPGFIYSLTFFIEYAVKPRVTVSWKMPFYLALKLSFWMRRKLGFWRLLFERPLYEFLVMIKRQLTGDSVKNSNYQERVI